MNKSLWATLAAPLLILIIYLTLSIIKLPAVNYTFLIAAVGVTATVYLGLVKYWIDSDSMFKSLFKDFNERFDLLNEDLNSIVLGTFSPDKKTSDQIIQDYLNLCAEEYYWFRKGRIPNAVWASWLAGIENYVSAPSIKTFFQAQFKYDKSYYGFLNSIKNNL